MRIRHLTPLGLVLAALGTTLALETPARASNEIAERTELQCTVCHDRPGSKLLTDRGKYYETLRTLEGFEEVSAVFGACTSCHVRKPGSTRLTTNGRRFQRLMIDMHGVREFAAAQHQWTVETVASHDARPAPSEPGPSDDEGDSGDPEAPAPEDGDPPR